MSNIRNTSANMDKKEIWFWNQSAKKLKFDSEYNKYSNLERDLESKVKKKRFKTEKKANSQN